MDASNFKEVVAKYIEYKEDLSTLQVFYSKEKAVILANEFECAESTVFRWVVGIANPLPRMKKAIIRFILNQK